MQQKMPKIFSADTVYQDIHMSCIFLYDIMNTQSADRS